MKKNLVSLAVSSAMLLGTTATLAAPFNSFDPKTMAMGGAGVAVANPGTAPFFNPALLSIELSSMEWDQGNEFFPPTTFQIANIKAGTGASNIIPGEMEVMFNFRYSTEVTHEQLAEQVEDILKHHELDYEITWSLSGKPFLTPTGELLEATRAAIKDVTGRDAEVNTAGGTSDGRFIAPTGAQVLELGPLNATIHKVNECVSINDLDALSQIYQRLLEHLLLD